MPKLFWLKFVPAEWMSCPELRGVSLAARGLWMDMLCLMFQCDRRGYLQLNNGKLLNAESLARLTGSSSEEISRLLQELETSDVFARTKEGCIYSRRLVRDERERVNTRERVAKHRGNSNALVTGQVTPPSNSNSNSSDFDVGFKERKEARRISDQELEMAAKSGSDELIERIVRLHPANWREKGRIQVPQAQAVAVMAAIVRDGRELVETGTANYGEAVKKWPKEDWKFAVNPIKFWGPEAHYLKDPQLWERGGNASKQIQKLQRSYEVIQAAVERSNGNADLGVCEVREGIDSAGSAIVVRNLAKSTSRSN